MIRPEDPLGRLARELGMLLAARGWMLATAESCTGGAVAEAITAIAGSSGWFERGFVTYANAAKIEVLGVDPLTLERHGAVSEAVAREMALGALTHSQAELALSITGIAGPDGGTPDKPVGTVCFGWAWDRTRPRVRSERRHFAGERIAVRAQAVRTALSGAIALCHP
ncbi:MAG: CinA family protein [Tepidiphilus sp.]|jgi:nicotinamide-nucleotide amidase|nr:CinA family protein [Tepidiphilus sp.]MDD3432887.1 CinA family protein [Tepidiphilus sp.]